MELAVERSNKPHAVCVPLPFSTHINHMLKLAKQLHYKGFHVTFALSDFFHQSLLSSKGQEALAGLPDFRFETYPLNYAPQPNLPIMQQLQALRQATIKEFLTPFTGLLARLNDTSSSSEVPPITCIVGDGALTFAVPAAEKFGLPIVLSWNTSANGFLSIHRNRQLLARSFSPASDVSQEQRNKDLDTVVDFIPGKKGIRMRDIPKIIQGVSNEYLIDISVGEATRTSKSSALILHSFDALEKDALNSLSSMFPRVFCIGPLPLQSYQNNEEETKLVGRSIWGEESDSLEWLDSNDPNSVIYVSFGTTTAVTPELIVEFAWGLANSNYPFLWIIAKDAIKGVLPPEFIEGIKDRGMLRSWCDQEKVLNHPSIGGFLTHCGWNSVFESIAAGFQ